MEDTKIIVGVIILLTILVGASYSVYFRSSFEWRRKILYVQVVIMIAVQVVVYWYVQELGKPKDLKPGVQVQIESLDEIEASLTSLKGFIESQRTKLQESEVRINELTQQRAKLQPLVEADKRIVEALFLVQEERNKKAVWLDRLIGALFGIFSSLVATVLYKTVTRT